ALGFASCVLLPLRAEGKTLGVLTLARGAEAPLYLERERTLLEAITDYTASALMNANRYQQARQESEEHRCTADDMARQRDSLKTRNTHLQRMMVETHHRVKNNLQTLSA